MSNFGELTMQMALIFISLSSVCYAVTAYKKDNSAFRNIARFCYIGFTGFITIASVLLMYFILNHNFVYSYIARYSSLDLPLLYLVSSFWAGQEGSFLLWVLLGAWLGIFLMYRAKDMEPHVMVIYNLTNFFLMILLIKQSPFQMLPSAPPDGSGMNMLLQDPWMAIHPPVVFLGYAAFAIPFAYAIAALWRREYDRWIKPALPWTVFAFISLGAGIIIGGYWAYKVLGWGGYWGWDPVENASLLPWLVGMALMHGMILQSTQKILQKTNFVLAIFSFILVIYCTFLTRSGVLADFSVHSFSDLGITGWLVLFMGFFIAISLYLFLTRAKEIPVPKEVILDVFSREFGFIAAMCILTFSALVTGFGTSAPLITRLLEKASKVSTEFYVKTNLPLAILLVMLLSFVPVMKWGKNSFARLTPKLVWPLIGAVATGAVILLNGYPGTGVFLLSVFAGAATMMNLFLAITYLKKRITISGGAVAHFGVGLMFLGIVASSIYDRSERVALAESSSQNSMGYHISFKGPRFAREGKGERVYLPLETKKGDNAFIAQPDIYSEGGKDSHGHEKRHVRPYIKLGFLSDLYISPIDFKPEEKRSEEHIDLKKGEKYEHGDYGITFTTFDTTRGMGQEDTKNLSVGAKILVSYKNEDAIELKPNLNIGGEHQHSGEESRVRLPGPQEAYLTLTKVNAGAKTIHVDYKGPTPWENADMAIKPATMIADISIKPGMTVLWLGTFLMMFGGGIAIVRRWEK